MKIRYFGHVGQRTGYGRAAEGMCMALLAAGVELEIRPLAPYDQVKLDSALPLASSIRRDNELTKPDAVIVHTLPMDCARVVDLAGLCALYVPLIAYTTWEGMSPIPSSMAMSLDEVFDQVWVPSTVNARLMAGLSEAPLSASVRVMPHAFDETTLEARRRLPSNNRPALFTFYYLGAWNSRKNPEGVIRAYTRIFNPEDPVCLVMRSAGTPDVDFALACARTGRPKPPVIRFNNKLSNDQMIMNLHAEADCFVTASRGEGWNLPAFEAMLAGRNIISPKNLGSDEFLDGTSAMRYFGYRQPAGVDARVVTAPDAGANTLEGAGISIDVIGAQGQSTVSDWQEPDLNQLAELMYTAYKGRTRDITVDYDVAERFGYHAVGKRALTYLEAL